MSDLYTFKDFEIKYGYMGGPSLELSKKQVWDKIKDDPDFWKQKLYEIDVDSYSHTSTMVGGLGFAGYHYPATKRTVRGRYWASNLKEAKKIGKVIRQIHPKPPTPVRGNQYE